MKTSISNEFRLISTLAMCKKKEPYVAPKKKKKNYTHTHHVNADTEMRIKTQKTKDDMRNHTRLWTTTC